MGEAAIGSNGEKLLEGNQKGNQKGNKMKIKIKIKLL